MGLPKTIYVKALTYSGGECLVADSSMFEVVGDDGEHQDIGIYVLQEIKHVRKILEVTEVAGRKRR